MYADETTQSMREAIDETNRRRAIQEKYNEDHGIIPQTILRSKEEIMSQTHVADRKKGHRAYIEEAHVSVAADPVVQYMESDDIDKLINKTRKAMEKAAKELDFIEAARLRDELTDLQELSKKKNQTD